MRDYFSTGHKRVFSYVLLLLKTIFNKHLINIICVKSTK